MATIDLSDPLVSVRLVAAGGVRSSGDWKTTLALPVEVADRESFVVAVNGSLFQAQRRLNLLGRETGYFIGNPANVVGWAMTDGVCWAIEPAGGPAMVVFDDGHVRICRFDRLPAHAQQAVGGSELIEASGRNVATTSGKAGQRYPRTAVGIDNSGRRLILLVVDGQRSVTVGATLRELGDEMIHQGCSDALSLDGGGSSVMVQRRAGEAAKVISWPSDGHDLPVPLSLQRPVASVLGIRCTTRPTTTPDFVP